MRMMGRDDRRRLAVNGLERRGGGDVGGDRRDREHGLLEALEIGALGGGEDPHHRFRSKLGLEVPERRDGRVRRGVGRDRLVGREESGELGAAAEGLPERTGCRERLRLGSAGGDREIGRVLGRWIEQHR